MDLRGLITEEHLARLALIYLRQSTEVQVRNNQGSTDHQRSQVDVARSKGWPAESIVVIDEDLGRSGTSAEHRPGFRRMLDLVKSGVVGAIFAADFSRLARNARDGAELVEECSIYEVLFVIDEQIYDPTDSGGRLISNMMLSVSEFQGDGIRATMFYGRLAKARKGVTVSTPPVGYVSQGGAWLLDPDPKVRETVRLVFQLYLELGSIGKVLKHLRSTGTRLPRRDKHIVRWIEPESSDIAFMLRNRAYVGDYVFRKRRTDKKLGRSGNGRWKDRPAKPAEMVLKMDLHEPYVTREEYDRVQQFLDRNAPRRTGRVGRGPALLQGVIRCGLHDGAMVPRYRTSPRGGHSYACMGERWAGGPGCKTVTAHQLDDAVVEAVRARLQPPEIEIVRDLWRAAMDDHVEAQRRHELELRHCRRREADLRARYMAVDPANRQVAAELEREFESAKRETARLEAQGPSIRRRPDFSEDDFTELLELCNDLNGLWNAPTTDSRDRKEIIHALVKAVIIEPFGEAVRGRIVWKDGAPDQPIEVPLTRMKHRILMELREQGLSYAATADRLNDLGLHTLKGTLWTSKTVYLAARTIRLRQKS